MANNVYVWDNPYPVNYGSSFLFVVAPDLDTAKRIAAKKATCHSFDIMWDESRAHLKSEFARRATPLGEPSRIIEGVGGEWHEWSE